MKDSYYFPHDYHARHDTKLQRVMLTIGCEGIGIYWCLIEILYENNGYFEIDDIPFIAKTLQADQETVNEVINNYDLFTKEVGRVTSKSLLGRLKHINSKRYKARASANKRWNANAMPTQCEGNAIKESKVKESKVNKNKHGDFVFLTDQEYNKIITQFGAAGAADRIEALNLYIGSKGDKYKSHYSTILNWERMNHKKQDDMPKGAAYKELK